ncbi:MAG: hypothetical protein WAR39_10035 [Prevotella sp.]
MKDLNVMSLKTLTKSNVWDIQENDVFRLIDATEKDADLKDNLQHYLAIMRSAFEMEEIKIDKPEIIKKYEDRGFKVSSIKMNTISKNKWAIKKRAIMRVTDLTYENIRHISASKLLEVIDRNFGGGWDSLSQSIRDIIESGFDISTTTLPQNRLHNPGGMYEKKVSDGFEVLEIAKGLWIEAIFAKAKPEPEKPKVKIEEQPKHLIDELEEGEEEDDDEELTDLVDTDEDKDEDDTFDEDKLTEESYRTTFDTDTEDLNLESEDVTDPDEDY